MMNGISMVISKPICPVYNLCANKKTKFGKSNKMDLIPHRLSNFHLQRISPPLATTRVLKHRVYAVKSDATSSRSELPKVSGAVKPYALFGTGIVGMALGILKLEACCMIFLGVASIFVAPDFLGKMMYGLILLHDKPFSNGDIIEVGRLKGQVLETGVMNTTLLTEENRVKEVQTSWFIGQVIKNISSGSTIVPHSLLLDQDNVNNSRRPWNAALFSKICVQADESEKILKITEEITNMLNSNSNVYLEEEQPFCHVSGVEPYYVELSLGCNLKQMSEREINLVKQDVLTESHQIIKKHGASLYLVG